MVFRALTRLFFWLQASAARLELRLNFGWPSRSGARTPRVFAGLLGLGVLSCVGSWIIAVVQRLEHPNVLNVWWWTKLSIVLLALRFGLAALSDIRRLLVYGGTGLRLRTLRRFKGMRDDRWTGYQPHIGVRSAFEVLRDGRADSKTQESGSAE